MFYLWIGHLGSQCYMLQTLPSCYTSRSLLMHLWDIHTCPQRRCSFLVIKSELQPLARLDVLSIRRVFVSCSQPIRFGGNFSESQISSVGPEVVILGADQKERSLWRRECENQFVLEAAALFCLQVSQILYLTV